MDGLGWTKSPGIRSQRPVGVVRLQFVSHQRACCELGHRFCALSFLTTGCQHPQSGKTSTGAEIRQHNEGQWTISTNSDGGVAGSQIDIAPGGGLWRTGPVGARELVGNWSGTGGLTGALWSWRRSKRITPSLNMGRRFPLERFFYKVVTADEHEPVLELDETVPGKTKLRFTG